MGQILVNTPQGKVKVNISGDEPNEQEVQAIQQTFFATEAPATSPEIDLATASMDEIRQYAQLKRAQGISPTTGEQITEEEFINEYKEPGVDYTSGVDNVAGFSRFQFGRMDTAEEKSAYLSQAVGPDGFRQDALGRFIVTFNCYCD